MDIDKPVFHTDSDGIQLSRVETDKTNKNPQGDIVHPDLVVVKKQKKSQGT